MRERKRQDRQNELEYRQYRNVLAVKPKSNLISQRPVKPNTLKKQKQEELQDMIHRIERGAPPTHPPFVSRNDVPFYNPEIHTTGDTVRIKDPKTGEIKVVTL